MDTFRALDIFEIEDINSVEIQDIKNKFRQLMKKAHPDVGGDEEQAKEINLAYEVVIELIEKTTNLKKRENIQKESKDKTVYVIPIHKLVDLYLGKEVEVGKGGNRVVINRKNLRYHKIAVLTAVTIVYAGEEYHFDNLSVLNLRDEYEINCKITVDDIFKDEEIEVRTFNKKVNTRIQQPKLDIVVSFEKLVRLKIHIERVEGSGQ